ncbi:MAG: UDP-3-O-(3-hydroxymyristoyl)glucosamine N-acyltransferase [Bacteroidota bacterium]|nr:UDP-3-O-(3-hydroxymyristoyl)glucosamine N-acyltransferase [Candidatus Kapabacteria bacterium]MCX7937098.1 UDP-3-O-(3-hydroxymyristoyl)glucosamine N-acyltransferase [Chlorobiota bacterium]MDW8074591.1 UDP-3-O-(3-hydroxymyristoyl)glucosamine N-acyltransferase [Bacteroidota bacterium]
MKFHLTLAEIANIIGVPIDGGTDTIITGVAPLDTAQADHLSFLAREEFLPLAATTQAGVVLTTERFAPHLPPGVRALIHPKPDYAFARVLAHVVSISKPAGGIIHHTASIAPSSSIAKTARIAAGVVIGEHCVIGENVEIGCNVVIEDNVTIGEDTVIESGAVICHGTVIGMRCYVGHGAVIGSEGFGYAEFEGQYHRLYHVGNVVIEDDVDIGANTCIDRGLLGSTIIRRGTKIDNLVHIAHNVEVGEHTAIAAQVGIAGSTRVGRRNRIGGQAGLTGHIRTTDEVTIGAQSGVSKSILQPGEYSGTPAVELKRRLRSEAVLRRLIELEPILDSLVHKLAPKPTDQLRDEQE